MTMGDIIIKWVTVTLEMDCGFSHQDVETVPGVGILLLRMIILSTQPSFNMEGAHVHRDKHRIITMTIMPIAMTIVIITIIPTIMMIITLVAQVHCPPSPAQELQTKVESSVLRGRQEPRART